MTNRNKWVIVALVLQSVVSALASSTLLLDFGSPLMIATVMTVNSMLASGTAAYVAAVSPMREVDKDGLRAASAAYQASTGTAPDQGAPALSPGD